MKNLIQLGVSLFKKYEEAIRYLFFGVLATGLNIVIYTLFLFAFGEGFANGVGNVLDSVICILFAYFTNRAFVFQSKTVGKAAAKEFTQFIGCRLGTLVLDAWIMGYVAPTLGAALIPAYYRSFWNVGMKILANVIVIVLNYILSKLIIFKKKQ